MKRSGDTQVNVRSHRIKVSPMGILAQNGGSFLLSEKDRLMASVGRGENPSSYQRHDVLVLRDGSGEVEGYHLLGALLGSLHQE